MLPPMNSEARSNRVPPVCQICGAGADAALSRAGIVRPAVADLVRKETGSWSPDGWICRDDLQRYRLAHVASLLKTEAGGLNALQKEVLDSLAEQAIFAHNPQDEVDAGLTRGQRLADHIASFGGSWGFILTFLAIMATWMILNVVFLTKKPFDPYPFILLNLVLSCLAALQAPVIMMSQKRQEMRDRLHSEHDYQVNLKAELEIRQLHQKFDHLLSHQWEQLLEMQEIQMDLLNEVRQRR
jgi:uncharacterized membrane protein